MNLLTNNYLKFFSAVLMTIILCSASANLTTSNHYIEVELDLKNLQCKVSIEGTIRDVLNNEPLDFSTIRVLDSIQTTIQIVEAKPDGKFAFNLECGQEYTLEIVKEGYKRSIDKINLTDSLSSSVMTRAFYLNPIRVGSALPSVSRDMSAFRSPPPPIKNWTTTYVDFATDRNYIQDNSGKEQFGNKRGTLNYGTCMVTIPIDHRVGEIERPSWLRLEFSENPENHIILQNVKVLDRASFMKSIAHKMSNKPFKRTFLFIHGYNVSFEDAALRTAQMSYDLKFDGAPVFYSWPSQSKLSAYFKDAQNISWAEHNITEFLEDYLENSGADEIYLIAHSMGNRGLTNAVISVLSKKPHLRDKIKEIILAAPDIDADIFKRDIAPQMVSLLEKPITLYVSSQDVALKASMEIHGENRAGDSKEEVIVLDGIETIDASSSKTNFLGHSYYADSSSIIGDLYDLIISGRRAGNRPKLKPIQVTDKIYWIVEE